MANQPVQFAKSLYWQTVACLLMLFAANAWADKESFTLDSPLPFHEVHIPAHISFEKIHVNAEIAGKTYDCIVDTGLNGVQVPYALRALCTEPIRREPGIDGGGHTADMILAQLPRLQIGAFTAKNLTVSYIANPTYPGERSDKGPIYLGTGAFSSMSLTVNFGATEIVLRDGNYCCSRVPHVPGSLLLELDHAKSRAMNNQWPTVTTYLRGKPLHFVVDTGWAGPECGITQSALDTNPELQSYKRSDTRVDFLFGKADVRMITGLSLQLKSATDEATVNQDAIVMAGDWDGIDGVFGTWVLQGFCVTFDTPHKLLLLEPRNSSSLKELSLNPHQEVHVHTDKVILIKNRAVLVKKESVVRFLPEKIVITAEGKELSILIPSGTPVEWHAPGDLSNFDTSPQITLLPGKRYEADGMTFLNAGLNVLTVISQQLPAVPKHGNVRLPGGE